MSHFPLSIDLKDRPVLLIGGAEQIRQKAEKLAPFGPRLIFREEFTAEELDLEPALVIVGDTPPEQARRISEACRQRRIPVNVVDVPSLCTFFFPALITRGELTVSVSTGGTSPAAAAWLGRHLQEQLPGQTDRILQWLCVNRDRLREMGILKAAVAEAFAADRPLTEEELDRLCREKAQ